MRTTEAYEETFPILRGRLLKKKEILEKHREEGFQSLEGGY